MVTGFSLFCDWLSCSYRPSRLSDRRASPRFNFRIRGHNVPVDYFPSPFFFLPEFVTKADSTLHLLLTMATESSFPVADTNINLRGEQFQANKKNWAPVLEKFEEALKQVSAEGNDVSLRRHQSRGQLLRMSLPALGELWLTRKVYSKRSRCTFVRPRFTFS